MLRSLDVVRIVDSQRWPFTGKRRHCLYAVGCGLALIAAASCTISNDAPGSGAGAATTSDGTGKGTARDMATTGEPKTPPEGVADENDENDENGENDKDTDKGASGTQDAADTKQGGASTKSGSSTPAGSARGKVGPCGIVEVEPNEDRETATAYELGETVATCIADAKDVDDFALTVPDASEAPAGGYVTVEVTDVRGAAAKVSLIHGDDNALIADFSGEPAASLFFYWAAAPGSKYRLAFKTAADRYTFEFKAVFHAADDDYEPNDVREDAAPIEVGTTKALLFGGMAGGKTAVIEDWYEVDLEPGAVRFALADVPANIAPGLTVFSADGATGSDLSVERIATLGSGISIAGTIPSKQTYQIRVRPSTGALVTFGKSAQAGAVQEAYFSPYTLTVTQ